MEAMKEKAVIIFSDLDSTLLEHHSYSFEAARPALDLIKKAGVPLIFCTSKTRLETEYWQEKLDIHHPFVVENGGAIYLPAGYFPFPLAQAKNRGRWFVIELGSPYAKLRQFLVSCQQQLDFRLRGFGDMSVEEITVLTGLSPTKAALAREREYDEPFICDDEKTLSIMKERAKKIGFKILGGSRFYHLTGENDKGKAVRILKELYSRLYGNIMTIALGDSHNDLAMLAAVDKAYLVQRHDGSYDRRVQLKGLVYVDGPGPEGWGQAILSFFAAAKQI